MRRAVATASEEQQRDAQNARQALNPRLTKAERQALPPVTRNGRFLAREFGNRVAVRFAK